jgi:hypothetical protein
MRRAFHDRGHWAVSCDLLPSSEQWYGFNPWHYQGDAFDVLARRCRPFYQALNDREWDLIIMHPVCTYLANSGVRWLSAPDCATGVLKGAPRREAMGAAVDFYAGLRAAALARAPRVAIENPVMHRYARHALNYPSRQVVQPWWFGDPAFKGTGFELHNLPKLVPTNRLTPPKQGTEEHKEWSAIHRCPPGPERAKIRSKTYPGIAAARAVQWGSVANFL